MKRGLVTLVALSLLSGCASGFKLHGGGSELSSRDLSVTPQADWNLAVGVPTAKHTQMLTSYGLGIDEILVIGGVSDGEVLFNRGNNLPGFRSDMLPNEIVELLQASISLRSDTTLFEAGQLKPVEFAGEPGFDFTYSFTGKDEIRRKGRAVGANVDGKLNLVVLNAPAVHYFDELLPEFERLVNSSQIRS